MFFLTNDECAEGHLTAASSSLLSALASYPFSMSWMLTDMRYVLCVKIRLFLYCLIVKIVNLKEGTHAIQFRV